MDTIYKCALNFTLLLDIQYFFIASAKRKARKIELDFKTTDFFHLAGLQHLIDIDLNQNRKRTMDLVYTKQINDILLSKSRFYLPVGETDASDIKSRIEELCYLEQYLDVDNIIKIYSLRNMPCTSSLIQSEYVIKSILPDRGKCVYIFLDRRKESESYCIRSFFPERKNAYGGDMLHWMLKAKCAENAAEILYQHPGFATKVD